MRKPRPGLPWSRARVRRRGLYCDYMASPEWFRRRERWLAHFRATHGDQEPTCVVCDELWTLRHGDLHHRTYARLGEEADADLIAMCREHHRALHVLMEKNSAWRRVPRQQATDLLVGHLRGRVGGNGR